MSWAVLVDICAALFFLATAVFVSRRRPPKPLWPTLLAVQLLPLLWIAGDIGTHLARDLFWEQLSITVIYSGSLFLLALWWLLAFRFAQAHGIRFSWAKPSLERAPLVWAAVTWACVATNPWHGQFLTPVIGARNEYHWLWWSTIPLGYLLVCLVAAGYATIFRRLRQVPGPRAQSCVMFIATLSTLLANAAYTLAPFDWPLDISVLGGLLTGGLFVVGIYRGTLFDLSAVALREVLRRDPSGLVVANPEGRLLYVNSEARALFTGVDLRPGGLVAEQLVPQLESADARDPELSPERLWSQISQVGFAGAPFRTTRGSSSRWLWVTSQPLVLRGHSEESLALRIQDVTALRDIESERRSLKLHLERADRLRSLGALAAGIAHEVNNPVGATLIAAEFAVEARRSCPDPEEREAIADDALATVIEQSGRAARVVRSMLHFARDGGGEKAPHDINQMVLQVCDFTREFARRHDASVAVDLAKDPPLVSLNPIEIEQVLINLIHNAVRSGKPGRQVLVRSEAAAGRVVVTVSDDGDGMSPEACERAFEPFYSRRRDRQGTGLGLSVVHGIVTDHGGEVRIDSRLGQGTTLSITLGAEASPPSS